MPSLVQFLSTQLIMLRYFSFVLSTEEVTNHTELFTLESNVSFPYSIISGYPRTLDFNYSFPLKIHSNPMNGWVIDASLDDENIISILGEKHFYIEKQYPTGTISVYLKAELPGRSTLHFHGKSWLNISQSEMDIAPVEDYGMVTFQLFSERKERPIDVAFNVVIILMVVIANVGMGAKIDLAIVKAELKRPIAPIIGLTSQFVIMPVVAFVIAYSFKLDPGIALGFFALGCSPGGSASNMYTYMFNGNVSLSVTMTFISTLASLGLLPLWLFTLGRIIYGEGSFKIPFENIFFSLIGIIIPIGIGIFLQHKLPKVAKIFIRAIKYIVALFLLFVFTVGIYANWYIFLLLRVEVLLGAALLPYVGFIMGGLVAFVFRQDMANIITIAVETGIQNTGIPIVLLRLSLQGPDKDTSIVAPVTSAILTPIPLVFGILYVQLKQYRNKKRLSKEQQAEGGCVFSDNETDTSKCVALPGDYLIVQNGDDNDNI